MSPVSVNLTSTQQALPEGKQGEVVSATQLSPLHSAPLTGRRRVSGDLLNSLCPSAPMFSWGVRKRKHSKRRETNVSLPCCLPRLPLPSHSPETPQVCVVSDAARGVNTGQAAPLPTMPDPKMSGFRHDCSAFGYSLPGLWFCNLIRH